MQDYVNGENSGNVFWETDVTCVMLINKKSLSYLLKYVAAHLKIDRICIHVHIADWAEDNFY